MKKILLIIDVQNDFCPGGNLAVADGAEIIPAINRVAASGKFDLVAATQDWHPLGHVSFAATHGKNPFETVEVSYGPQMLWPTHCVQGTSGAKLHQALDANPIQFIVRKGYHKDIDSYSAFFENDKKTATGLAGLISHIAAADSFELAVCGIATDVCVFNTALDARKILNYNHVSVILDASAGVNEAGVKQAVDTLISSGVHITNVAQYL
jgi:nicotinamidase/pyrazinamidase